MIWRRCAMRRRCLPATCCARAAQVWDDGDWSIEASDATGLILFVLHLFVTNAAALTEPRR